MSWLRYLSYHFYFLYAIFKVHIDNQMFYLVIWELKAKLFAHGYLTDILLLPPRCFHSSKLDSNICGQHQMPFDYQVENTRFELVTSCLQGRRSPNWANPPFIQRILKGMGLSGLEPPTSRLSGVRSNRLSYQPICINFLTLAATYSPAPSPVKYHRPLKA